MHGCCGHMGQVISDLAAKDAEAAMVAGIDIEAKGNNTYPVVRAIKACQKLGWQLDIIGKGPDVDNLKNIADKHTNFL